MHMAGPPNQRLLGAPSSPQPFEGFQEEVDIVQLSMTGQLRQRERPSCFVWVKGEKEQTFGVCFLSTSQDAGYFLFHFICFLHSTALQLVANIFP